MEISLIIVLAVIVLGAIGAVVSYNRFVSQKTLIKDAWANIDTELRRRYDLIPNLVETVKGYATHEREVLENVTRARAMAASATGSPAEQAAAEGPLVAALRQLMLVVENYPDLKANQNFLQLQGELTNTEDRLQTARRFYNANVRDFNRRVKQFPSMIVASLFGFKEEEFFEVEDAIREGGPPQVDFGAPSGTGAPLAGQAGAPAFDVTTSPAAPPPPADDVPEPPDQPTPPTPTG
ncbi:MAG TPA: LemA family protein [Actinomycetota bacterium]